MKLVRGQGSINTGACWMNALSFYAGYAWSDHPECVDDLVRRVCIVANDTLSDHNRERIIGPHLMAPLGTRILDPKESIEVDNERRRIVEATIQELTTLAWERSGQAPLVAEVARNVWVAPQMRLLIMGCLAHPMAKFAVSVRLDLDVKANKQDYQVLAPADVKDQVAAEVLVPTILALCKVGQKCEVPQKRSLELLPQ